MKQVLLVIVAVIGFTALSQAQLKLGIKAGGNLNNQRLDVSQASIYAADNLKGYHAGLIADLDLGNNFYLQPQLLFSRKGAMQQSSIGDKDIKVRMNYLELPVNMVYKFDLGFSKAFVGAGAAFSYGIGGKEVQGDVSKKIYRSGSDWRREDVSLSFTAGLEFSNGFFASINSQKGLWDIHRADNITITNKSLSVSVGYLVDWKKLKRRA